jgi:hypothetical protein
VLGVAALHDGEERLLQRPGDRTFAAADPAVVDLVPTYF